MKPELHSLFTILKDKEVRYELHQLFGEDAFYDTLEDVMKDYQQQTGATG